ncbi:MAG: J domain-containing protein [Myxococcales bacterium]|nr:J domain-containing protein [Myxococcales bacterium]
MTAKKNFYQVLGVAESAPADEIKKAYRKLARKNHPDATGGDKTKEARFKEISEAYETVGDDKKRAQYDAERQNPFGAGMPRQGRGGGSPFGGGGRGGGQVDLNEFLNQMREQQRASSHAGPSGGGGGGGIGDLFAEFFGGSARPPSSRGSDTSAQIEVDLAVAALGGDQPVVVDGKRWTVKIPAGVEEGQTIRVTGKGAPGRGSPGDLLLEIHIKPHPTLRRTADDLEVDVPITIDQAVLGAKVDVPTLEGKVQVTIPPATSSGLKLRLRGKGIPRRDGTRGDLYAVTQIVLPKEIPPRARELIVEFAKLTSK